MHKSEQQEMLSQIVGLCIDMPTHQRKVSDNTIRIRSYSDSRPSHLTLAAEALFAHNKRESMAIDLPFPVPPCLSVSSFSEEDTSSSEPQSERSYWSPSTMGSSSAMSSCVFIFTSTDNI